MHQPSFDVIQFLTRSRIARQPPHRGKAQAEAYWDVRVFVAVNTRPLLARDDNFVLDLLRLTECSAGSGPLPLFNCVCGVPWCAQVRESPRQEVQADTVQWDLPVHSFAKRLNPEFQHLLEGRDNVTLRFERQQFERALDDVCSRLLQLETSSALPVCVMPDGGAPQLEQTWESRLRKLRRNPLALNAHRN